MEPVLVRNLVLTLLFVYLAVQLEDAIVPTVFIYKEGVVFARNIVAASLMGSFYRKEAPTRILLVLRGALVLTDSLYAITTTDVMLMQLVKDDQNIINVTVIRDTLAMESLAKRYVLLMKHTEHVLAKNLVITQLAVYPAPEVKVLIVIALTDFTSKEGTV